MAGYRSDSIRTGDVLGNPSHSHHHHAEPGPVEQSLDHEERIERRAVEDDPDPGREHRLPWNVPDAAGFGLLPLAQPYLGSFGAAGNHPDADVEQHVDGGNADRPDRDLAEIGLAQHSSQIAAVVTAQVAHGLVLEAPEVAPAGNGDDDGASRLHVLGDLPGEAE